MYRDPESGDRAELMRSMEGGYPDPDDFSDPYGVRRTGEVNLGPLVNPDGTASDVTLAMFGHMRQGCWCGNDHTLPLEGLNRPVIQEPLPRPTRQELIDMIADAIEIVPETRIAKTLRDMAEWYSEDHPEDE